jgi:hypothetical protein
MGGSGARSARSAADVIRVRVRLRLARDAADPAVFSAAVREHLLSTGRWDKPRVVCSANRIVTLSGSLPGLSYLDAATDAIEDAFDAFLDASAGGYALVGVKAGDV